MCIDNNVPEKSEEERKAILNKLLPLFEESAKLIEECDPSWKAWKKLREEGKIK